jgi:hypothetical protein
VPQVTGRGTPSIPVMSLRLISNVMVYINRAIPFIGLESSANLG